MKKNKKLPIEKRHRRILMKIRGTPESPRLLIKRTLKNLAAQLIDDTQGKTIFSLSTKNKDYKGITPTAGNVKSAVIFAELFAKKAKEKGLTKIKFDRAGNLYHGRVKAFADALRKAGMEF